MACLTSLSWVIRFLWHLALAPQRKFEICNHATRGADKIFTLPTMRRAAQRKFLTTLDWVTRFLWYLARAQRGENFAFATLARAARRKIRQR